MEISSLYIIKRDTGVCLYHKDFTESAFDPQLLSSFLVAMTSFFDEATRSVTSQARAFEGTHYKIIVEFGDWTLGAVSTKEDSAFARSKLKRLSTGSKSSLMSLDGSISTLRSILDLNRV